MPSGSGLAVEVTCGPVCIEANSDTEIIGRIRRSLAGGGILGLLILDFESADRGPIEEWLADSSSQLAWLAEEEELVGCTCLEHAEVLE